MRKAIFLLTISLFYSAYSKAQDTLKKNLSNAAAELPYYCIDENGKEYQFKSFAGSYYVDFSKVEMVEGSDSFLIEGYVLLSNTKDYGMIGINIILGKLKKSTIYSVRRLGESNDMNINPEHMDGFFSFRCKVYSDDMLFFSGIHGGGLTAFQIGKLVAKENCQCCKR